MSSEPEIVTVTESPTAVVRGTVPMQEITAFYDRAFGTIAEVMADQGVMARAALGLYLSPPTDVVTLEVGFVVDSTLTPEGEVVPSVLPGGEAARMTHLGPYEGLPGAWGGFLSWVGEQGRAPAGPLWEIYLTEPTPETDPATLETQLFCLLA